MMSPLWLILFANSIAAAPSIVLPINSQVPPVARTAKAFQFVFSESTFASSAPSIDYSLSKSPLWLQLDSPSRTLSGTPGSEDVGSVPFNLVATDSTGSISMPVTLIVSNDPGPSLGIPLSDQIRAKGSSSKDSLLMPHSASLSISFLPNTFINTNDHTLYYAICANNTPLPSWINFNPNTLSFTGTTPEATSPVELSQPYSIKLTASDVAGFSGAVAEFQIIVESHVFAFSTSLQKINATQGSQFNFSELQTDLRLDGNPVNRSDIAQIIADTPDWVSFDQRTLNISGIPPMSAASQNFTVTAKNMHGDVAETTIELELSELSPADLFEHPIEGLNATIGMDFEYVIDRSVLRSPNTTISVNLGEASSWLKFDPDSLRFYGSVPNDIQPQQNLVNVTATQGPNIQSLTVPIAVGRNENDKNGSIPTGNANNLGTGSTDGPLDKQPTNSRVKKHWLPYAIAIPIAVVLGVLLSACLYVRKRRRGRSYVSHSPSKEKISRPMPTDSSWVTVEANETDEKAANRDVRNLGLMQNRTSAHTRRGSSRPPKVELRGLLSSSPTKRGSMFRRSRSAVDCNSQAIQRDSWREYICNFHGVRPDSAAHASRLIPEEERSLHPKGKHRFSKTRQSDLSGYSFSSYGSQVKRYSRPGKSRSGMSLATTSLFSPQHLHGFGRARSGMGHGIRLSDGSLGRYRGGPRGFGMIRNSWRHMSTKSKTTTPEYATTTDSSSSSQNLTSQTSEKFASLVQAFPYPASKTPNIVPEPQASPSPSHRPTPSRPTIRIVHSPPLRRKPTLQTFHKHRISSRQAQNPLFSAGPSSRASSWKKPPTPTPTPTPTPPSPHFPLHSPSPSPPASPTSTQRFASISSSSSSSSSHPNPPAGIDFWHHDHDANFPRFWSEGESRVVLGTRELRPVSVEPRGTLGKGASMRGVFGEGVGDGDGDGDGEGGAFV